MEFDDERAADYFAENIKSNNDHITALGFVNDGYDYSQHLKEMGTFHREQSLCIVCPFIIGGSGIIRRRKVHWKEW